jgi:D-alanine-D-alanine ligase
VIPPEEARRGRAVAAARIVEEFGTPVVVKDPTGGSSLEVRICDGESDVAAALEDLSRAGGRLMAEAYVKGRELTAGVIELRDRPEPVALPLVEIRPRRSRSFDYREKYAADGAEELCPAPVAPEVEAAGRALGLRIHSVLGLRGISRTDLILDAQGRLTVLEVNTLPGMTSASLVPKAAHAAGIPFPDLLEHLVRSAALS